TPTMKIIIQTSDNVIRVPNTALRFKPTADMYAVLGVQPPAQGQGRGQNGGGGNGGANGGGGGFGQGSMASMTPEQRQKLMNQFGGGRGGRGGRNGRPATEPDAPIVPITERNADRIDDLFAPLQRTTLPGTVYVWDEAGKQLKRVAVGIGITDGQTTEIVSGDIQPGAQVVTRIIIPVSLRPTTTGNPLMGNQPRGGGPGGMQPGGGGGGGRPGGGAGS
ncbi:MAG TPA: hypothetical protein VIX35_10720, partial [Vicinamibacterales bacterium]